MPASVVRFVTGARHITVLVAVCEGVGVEDRVLVPLVVCELLPVADDDGVPVMLAVCDAVDVRVLLAVRVPLSVADGEPVPVTLPVPLRLGVRVELAVDDGVRVDERDVVAVVVALGVRVTPRAASSSRPCAIGRPATRRDLRPSRSQPAPSTCDAVTEPGASHKAPPLPAAAAGTLASSTPLLTAALGTTYDALAYSAHVYGGASENE